jgi:hypothetical protein
MREATQAGLYSENLFGGSYSRLPGLKAARGWTVTIAGGDIPAPSGHMSNIMVGRVERQP